MKRKILGLVLVLCMLTAFAPCVSAATVVNSGVCGDNLTWTLDDEGTLTISGSGDMYDYDWSFINMPWRSNLDDIKEIIVDDGVASIAEEAFWSCSNLESVTFGKDIQKIGRYAFNYCNSLKELHISDMTSYLNIDFTTRESTPMYYSNCHLFLNGEIVKSPTIPQGIIRIPYFAFSRCDFSTELIIPDSVQYIDDDAFCYCENLESIVIPDTVKSVVGSAFYNTAYYNDENNWENGVLYIGNHLIEADEQKIGTEYIIKEGTKTISDSAFYWCDSLRKITIPDSVVTIGSFAFSRTAITEVIIPDSVISIGFGAFENCGSLTNAVIGNGITEIAENMFNNCGLNSITLSKNITKIGKYAFRECYELQDIYYGGTEADWEHVSIGESNGLSKVNIHCKSKEDRSYKCRYLTLDLIDGIVTDCDKEAVGKIEIPSEVNGVKITQIGQYAFSECSSITEIVIPNSITEIGYSSFADCSGLIQIVIPDSVQTISNFAFLGCENLTDIDIHENIKDIGGGAFRNTGYYNNPNNWHNGILYLNNYLIETNDDFTEADYKVNEGAKLIGGRAFWGRNIESIVIPSSVKGIGAMAFYRCEAFSDIYYESSQDEWNKIEIGETNDELTNAIIHYNAIGSEPPTINGGIVYNNGDGTYYFKTDILNVQYVSYIIGALYNNGVLVGMNIQPLTVGERGVAFTVNTSDVPNTAKLFIWSNPENICPLCEAKSLSIE